MMLSRLLLQKSAGRASSASVIGKHVNRIYSNSSSAHPLSNKSAATQCPQIFQSQEYKFQEGQVYEGFECIRTERVPEFYISSYTFRHLHSGTELWYLDRNDPNNVFSVNFRTTPFDSTGLPHILEHTVLCGSKMFPVRDPFFKMLNRSVATFMNAMTGPDYTIYPFSSMNETDFRNLQNVYLDAVFRPNLSYLDFLQEGWRLEHSNVHDKNSELVLKGVVYNEMKGAFSENSSIFGQNLLNNLLPDHTYGHVSGGNPLEIPKLTHKNLVDFHSKYYHPSNARIYVYGSFDVRKTLKYVNENYLSKFDAIDNSYSRIPKQKRWEEARNVHISSRFDNMGAPFEKQNQIAIGLLMSDITNVQETFLLQVLTELLVRGPNSAFYKSLIEPNFCGGYNQVTGYDSQVKDTFFSVGLQDVRVEDFPKVQELFESTIKDIITNGFDKLHVESNLHNIELSLKHQTPQFGLGLLFNQSSLWIHEGDVVKSLHVSNMIADLRNKLKQEPTYLQKKVDEYFINNSHKLVLTMTPDESYEVKFKAAELELLKQKIIALDHEKREKIYENGLKLEEAQKAPPNISVLPCLKLDDVKEAHKLEPINVVKIKQVPTQFCNIQTNGISYFKSYFDGANLSPEEIMLLPIFCNVIDEMGTQKYDYREFDKVVLSKTGGINFKLHVAENIYDSKSYDLGIYMHTHALDQNVGDMFELCNELLTKFTLADKERLTMLLDSYISNMSVGIASSGHLYAMQTSAGLVSNAAQLKSKLVGVEHIDFMKNYVKSHTVDEIMESLKNLGHKLFRKNTMRGAINTSEDFHPIFIQHYEKFLDGLPCTDTKHVDNRIELLEPSCQHIILNVPVNYCAKAFYTVPYADRHHPTLRLLAKFISAKYLLPVVREQNGAYGAGAKISADGIFTFYSYRDPNSVKTLEAFDNTYQWLQQHASELNEQNLFEAKLGVLQQLDAPVAPGNLGIDFFLYGVSHDMFMKYRSRMLAVTLNDVKQVVEKYFSKEAKHYGKCILGPENKELETETKQKWKVVS